MSELRAIVPTIATVPKSDSRHVAIEGMRRMGTFDARRVRYVGTTEVDGISPDIECRVFAVDATPRAA